MLGPRTGLLPPSVFIYKSVEGRTLNDCLKNCLLSHLMQANYSHKQRFILHKCARMRPVSWNLPFEILDLGNSEVVSFDLAYHQNRVAHFQNWLFEEWRKGWRKNRQNPCYKLRNIQNSVVFISRQFKWFFFLSVIPYFSICENSSCSRQTAWKRLKNTREKCTCNFIRYF